jgi:hypothetical protein
MMAVRTATDDLVNSLVGQLQPVPRKVIPLRLTIGVIAGGAISIALLLFLIGARPDLMSVLGSRGFLSKTAYMVATAALSLFAASRLARPGTDTKVLWLLPLPLFVYLPVGILELARTDSSEWLSMLLGHGWQLCTWLVLLLSVPVFGALWWAFRKFAPTNVEAAGAVAGLSASAIAAVVYCLHCPTDTAVFALAWYTLAFALAAAMGSVAGRYLLRW